MTISPPTERGTLLSPEQRRRLGEVYRLILSWPPGDEKIEKDPRKLSSSQSPTHPSSSDDNSKGGANG
jgi:hypothetical protein